METAPKQNLRRAGLLAIAALTGLTLTNCTSLGGSSSSMNYDPPAHRPTNPSAVRVKVSTSKQAVYVMEGNRVLMATPCSVGTPQAPTPAGTFRIFNKDFRHRRASSPGAGYPMTYWCEFAPAYGLHWGFVKPYPCTHGCIRLPKMAAAKFFAMVSVGTPINIASHQPEDATVGATLPVLDDSSLPNPPDSYLKSNQVFEDAKYKGAMFVD
ncbi:MAG: L,D-transpeptidase [Verrucomicrobia bacterium]|nr:L,D-transpeptidase [Verrucomicrobiota bacterium]